MLSLADFLNTDMWGMLYLTALSRKHNSDDARMVIPSESFDPDIVQYLESNEAYPLPVPDMMVIYDGSFVLDPNTEFFKDGVSFTAHRISLSWNGERDFSGKPIREVLPSQIQLVDPIFNFCSGVLVSAICSSLLATWSNAELSVFRKNGPSQVTIRDLSVTTGKNPLYTGFEISKWEAFGKIIDAQGLVDTAQKEQISFDILSPGQSIFPDQLEQLMFMEAIPDKAKGK